MSIVSLLAVSSSGMAHAGLGSLAMWQQGQEVVQVGSGRLVTIFIGLATLALVSQAIVLVAVGLGVLKAIKAVMGHVNDIKAKAMPIIDKAQGIVASAQGVVADLQPKIKAVTDDLTPKIKSVTDDLTPKIKVISSKVEEISGHAAEISAMVKDKVAEFGPTVDAAKVTIDSANQTVMDATQKTHEQILRVNEMISSSLDATQKASKSIRHTVTQPGREVAGFVSGVTTAFKTFFGGNGKKDATYRAPYRENPATANTGSTTPYASATERSGEETSGL